MPGKEINTDRKKAAEMQRRIEELEQQLRSREGPSCDHVTDPDLLERGCKYLKEVRFWHKGRCLEAFVGFLLLTNPGDGRAERPTSAVLPSSKA